MTIRFAAAWGGKSPAIVRALCPSAPLSAVNDNHHRPRGHLAAAVVAAYAPSCSHPQEAANDQRLLAEALRHFARHGLSAAAHARANAEAARASGDDETCRWWISICRQLDRRMADALANRIARRG